MNKIRISMISATTLCLLFGAALPSYADPSTPSPAPNETAEASPFASLDEVDLQDKIDKHISAHGGRRQGKNQIIWEEKDGRKAVMTFPAPKKSDDVSTYARAHCPYGYYCVYEHALWDREGGAMLTFYYYGKYNLFDYGWQYKVSALENNQTDSAYGALIRSDWYYSHFNRSWAWYKADGLSGAHNDAADQVQVLPLYTG